MERRFYRWEGADLLLELRVQPRAKVDALAGAVDGPNGPRLKVRIAAPPLDGRANEQLCAFLAECCGVPQGQVALLRGAGGRDKTLRIASPRRLPEGVQR